MWTPVEILAHGVDLESGKQLWAVRRGCLADARGAELPVACERVVIGDRHEPHSIRLHLAVQLARLQHPVRAPGMRM
jgi:hypothetical protein